MLSVIGSDSKRAMIRVCFVSTGDVIWPTWARGNTTPHRCSESFPPIADAGTPSKTITGNPVPLGAVSALVLSICFSTERAVDAHLRLPTMFIGWHSMVGPKLTHRSCILTTACSRSELRPQTRCIVGVSGRQEIFHFSRCRHVEQDAEAARSDQCPESACRAQEGCHDAGDSEQGEKCECDEREDHVGYTLPG